MGKFLPVHTGFISGKNVPTFPKDNAADGNGVTDCVCEIVAVVLHHLVYTATLFN
jgi:hypothetical protein